MTADQIPEGLRTKDEFHHVDPGIINHRLCIQALHRQAREWFLNEEDPKPTIPPAFRTLTGS